ncbi:hypothetical protein TNCV_4488831 [Trichonephila clavipes]|nr:hypothetical protein TNCV_4488831 [Trichonephila clavipes]
MALGGSLPQINLGVQGVTQGVITKVTMREKIHSLFSITNGEIGGFSQPSLRKRRYESDATVTRSLEVTPCAGDGGCFWEKKWETHRVSK